MNIYLILISYIIISTNGLIISAYFGIFDSNYQNTIENTNITIPWHTFNRIYIAFATLDKNGNVTNYPYFDEKIIKIVTTYRKIRPDGEVLFSLDYGTLMDDYYVIAAKHPKIFAISVLNYVKKYNLTGVDIDWETAYINDLSNYLVSLISACKVSFNGKYKVTHTIMPNVHSPKTVGKLSDIVDEINIMSYFLTACEIEETINQYNKYGFPYNKIILGISSENDFDSADVIKDKFNLIHKYGLVGVFLWRLDNDLNPIFKITNIIEKYRGALKN